MQQNNTQDELTKAVLSKAIGCKTCEVIEEYAKEDGDITLVKKKITTKYLPPDMMAVKTLMAAAFQQDDTIPERWYCDNDCRYTSNILCPGECNIRRDSKKLCPHYSGEDW